MGESNNGMVIVMSMMMSMSGCMLFFVAALIAGVLIYRQYNDETVKTMNASWVDHAISLPEEAHGDTDENCVYFYDHGKKWTDGDGKDGTIKSSGQWCISDGVDKHIPIWETKKQRGNLGHNKVDYIRLGKNLNVSIWNNHNKLKGDDFKGKGSTDTLRGGSYGLSKLISVEYDTDIKGNDIDAFMITKP